jgi:hypothetical protein
LRESRGRRLHIRRSSTIMQCMNEAEAYSYTVGFLRQGIVSPPPRSPQGNLNDHALDVRSLIGSFISEHEPSATDRSNERMNELSPVFLSAVWELCLLGVLRPGYPNLRFVGNSSDSYSVTESGKKWLREAGESAFIPIDFESFSTILEPFAEFSPVFFERARDAALCWKAQAYFACCAMCGAAAEAVLLSAAIAKVGEGAIATYVGRSGRARTETLVVGEAKAFVQQQLHPLFGLIAYWRDQSAHGAVSGVSRSEALTALRGLFYYAKLVHENWSELTQQKAG